MLRAPKRTARRGIGIARPSKTRDPIQARHTAAPPFARRRRASPRKQPVDGLSCADGSSRPQAVHEGPGVTTSPEPSATLTRAGFWTCGHAFECAFRHSPSGTFSASLGKRSAACSAPAWPIRSKLDISHMTNKLAGGLSRPPGAHLRCDPCRVAALAERKHYRAGRVRDRTSEGRA